MRRWLFLILVVILTLGVSGAWLADERNQEVDSIARTDGSLVVSPTAWPTPYPDYVLALPESCPVTRPPTPRFIPPDPWPFWPPSTNQFWYGNSGLWTALPATGSWPQLARGEKFWWWSEAYDVSEDATPDLKVTARRLDGDAAAFRVSGATNGYHESFNWAMLVGVELPTPGCWEFTGAYIGHQLSFVLWVPYQ